MIYIAVFGCLVLLRFALSGQPRLSRQIYFIVLFSLFVFVGFRYEVGCDWYGYYFQFVGAQNFTLDAILTGREPIWRLILLVQQNLKLPYPWINVLAAAVFFGGFHVLAKRQSDPLGFLVLAYPILIINMPMSAIRQGAAIGLLCMAICALLDRRTLYFVCLVLIASGFHSSASIFLLLAPLIGGKKLSGLRIALTALLTVPGLIVLSGSNAADLAMDRYVLDDVDSFGAIYRVSILAISAVYFLLFLRKPWARANLGDQTAVTIGAFGMLAVWSLLPVSTVIADRMTYYLIPIQIMIFARIPYLPIPRYRSLYAVLPYLGLAIIFIYWTLNSQHFQNCYLPYQSWIGGLSAGSLYEK